MKISITPQEKIRLGLTGNEDPNTANQKYGLYKEGVNLEPVEHTWIYRITDEKKFMLACIEYGIKFEHLTKSSEKYSD